LQGHNVNTGHRKGKPEKEIIDGNFVVPDVYMKTKYGSIAQYNYDIKEEQENKRNVGDKYGSPVKPTTDKSEPPSIVNKIQGNI